MKRFAQISAVITSLFIQTTSLQAEPAEQNIANDMAFGVQRKMATAAVAKIVVESFRAKTIPENMKTLLLEGVRSADKIFATSKIVQWKNLNSANIVAAYDQLIVRDQEGFEVARVQATTTNEFLINGKSWTVPKTGSIEKSLRQVLTKTKTASTARSLNTSTRSAFAAFEAFASPSPAGAQAASTTDAVTPIFVYTVAVNNAFDFKDGKFLPPSVKSADILEYVVANSPSKPLREPGSKLAALLQTLNPFDDGVAKVQCAGDSALGNAQIAGHTVQFESRHDGSLVLNLKDQRKVLLVQSPTDESEFNRSKDMISKITELRAQKVPDLIKADVLFTYLAQTEETSALYKSSYVDAKKAILQARVATPANQAAALENAFSYLELFYRNQALVRRSDAVTIAECADAKCAKTTTKPTTSLRPWFRNQAAVKTALAWKSDIPGDTSKIVLGPGDHPDLIFEGNVTGATMNQVGNLLHDANGTGGVTIWNGKTLSTAPALPGGVPSAHAEILSLRPLGECCKTKVCRDSMPIQTKLVEDPKSTGTRQ